MRYRPFGKNGVSVSVLALVIDEKLVGQGDEALRAMIYAALEAGINTYHLECSDPQALTAVGECLSAVERSLIFVSLRLGYRTGDGEKVRDFSPQALTVAIEGAIYESELKHLDLVLLDDPSAEELPTTALSALKQQRTMGQVSALGVGGLNDAMDAYLATRAFDVFATPFHLRSGWKERARMKSAAQNDLGVIAYDYYPTIFHPAAAPPPPPKRRLFFGGGAAAAAPAEDAVATQGMGTYSFLHNTRNWTAEELCLAYAIMEPSVSTVLIRAHDLDRLANLASVPDRDLPVGMAAQVEMARFGTEP